MLYGGAEQCHFSLSEVELNKVVFNPDVFKLELDLNDKKVDCIIQDIQFHPVTDRVTHVDLLEVLPGKPVKVELLLRTTGQAIGVMNGGRLNSTTVACPYAGWWTSSPNASLWTSRPWKLATTPVCVTSTLKASTSYSAKAPSWWLASAHVQPCLPNLHLTVRKAVKEGGEAAEGGEGGEG